MCSLIVHVSIRSMKVLRILIILISICTPAFAYAGMADGMTNVLEGIFTVLAIQILCYLYLRFFDTRKVRRYKRRVMRSALYLHNGQWTKWLSAWILSWIVIFPYIMLSCVLFFVIAFFPFYVSWICYCSFVWNNERRHKYLTGKKALARLLLTAIPLIVGGAIIFLAEILLSLPYTYSLLGILPIAFIFAIPFVLLLAIEGMHRFYWRLLKKEEKAEGFDGISQQTIRMLSVIKFLLIGMLTLLVIWWIYSSCYLFNSDLP